MGAPRSAPETPGEVLEGLLQECRVPEERRAFYLRRLSEAVWREIGLAVRLARMGV